MNHTSIEFLEFMDDIAKNLKELGLPWEGYESASLSTNFSKFELHEWQFDKKRTYDRFIHEESDFKAWLKQRTFNAWLKQYGEVRLGIKNPKEWKSNGVSFIQFISDAKS